MSTVLALHAFTRGPRHLTALSAACASRGWDCLRPVLAPRWFPIAMNDRRHLDRIARRLSRSGRLEGSVVVVGHSAGAAAGCWITPTLRRAGVDVRGLVLVDGNDSPNHLIERSWDSLADVPVRAVMSPPNPCNRDGRLTAFLNRERPESVIVVPAAGHGDLEMTGAPIFRRVCGDRSGPQEWTAVQRTVLTAIGELMEGRQESPVCG